MARRKNIENVEFETENTVELNETSNDSLKNTETITNSIEISEDVDKLLKRYPNYSALYIDSKGGVYPENTQPNLVEGAILYQNPYYKL